MPRGCISLSLRLICLYIQGSAKAKDAAFNRQNENFDKREYIFLFYKGSYIKHLSSSRENSYICDGETFLYKSALGFEIRSSSARLFTKKLHQLYNSMAFPLQDFRNDRIKELARIAASVLAHLFALLDGEDIDSAGLEALSRRGASKPRCIYAPSSHI